MNRSCLAPGKKKKVRININHISYEFNLIQNKSGPKTDPCGTHTLFLVW